LSDAAKVHRCHQPGRPAGRPYAGRTVGF